MRYGMDTSTHPEISRCHPSALINFVAPHIYPNARRYHGRLGTPYDLGPTRAMNLLESTMSTPTPDTRGPLRKLLDAVGDHRPLAPIPTVPPITVRPAEVMFSDKPNQLDTARATEEIGRFDELTKDEPRELPTPFTVELDAILTQGELYLLLRRAGLRLKDRGENKPYLLTIEPQSVLSRVGHTEAARALINAEVRKIKREHAAWNVGRDLPMDAESVARRRNGEYTVEEVDAAIRRGMEDGTEP